MIGNNNILANFGELMMIYQETDHLKKLREKHQRRLRILESQAATFGIVTPPHILIEIEDIKETIASIDVQLAEEDAVHSQNPENRILSVVEEKSLGLSPSLLKRLRTTLINCDWFTDNARLKTLFIDQRIAEWKDSLPEADNSTARVTSTLNYLHSSRNHRSENGLVLFLHVLADNLESSNALHRELIDLATELEKDLQDRC